MVHALKSGMIFARTGNEIKIQTAKLALMKRTGMGCLEVGHRSGSH